MADYENLLDSIDAVIRSNNRREITGQILQNTLHQMVASLGENYQLAGFATPTLDPSEPDQNVFYLTDEAGVYTNFDNITLGNGLSFLMWKNGAWSSKTMNIVTAQWVNDNFVSKAFLRQLFRAYDEDGVEIFANDTTSIIDNIKAMCGLWTNQYLSALGLGADGGGGASTLAGLNDVQLDNLQDGQALVYDIDSFHWVNRTIQSGVDMSVVWAALAAATNEQINVSHLTTALSGYVTSTALATTLANYVTTTALASALADYAAKSWVETNYVSKTFFNSLFQAEDSDGNAIAPNNSGQTAIDRLKILIGAYTDQYLSALGLSEEAGASSYLYGLGDVQLDTQTLAGGQALVYSAALGKWTNGEAGVNMVQVWTALATADATKQIDISHISSALSGYVTISALSTTLASYVTTSALSTTLADYVTNTSLTTTLAAYGTKSWVESNYISKAFFNRLFRAFAPVAEGESEAAQVEPNDVTTEIDNIKAMFGLWTEQYLSALGLGSDAGHTIGVLDELNDVTITNPQTDQVLKYNGTQWVNAAAPSGASALSGLTDVAISSLADKDLLQWDYATGKWKNVVLSIVMSGYATQSWVNTQLGNYLREPKVGSDTVYESTSYRLFNSATETGIGLKRSCVSKFYIGTYNTYGYICSKFGDNAIYYTFTDSLFKSPNQIEATGFVKTNGTSSQFLKADGSIDSNSYALSSALNNYLLISSVQNYALPEPTGWGGTQRDSASYHAYNTTNETGIGFKRNGSSSPFFIGTYNAYGYICTAFSSDRAYYYYTFTDSLFKSPNPIEATSFVKTNGTSSQFLKADGSVDSNTYALSSALNNYVPTNNVQGYAIPEPTNYTYNAVETTSFRVYGTSSETGIGLKRNNSPKAYIGCYDDKMYLANNFGESLAYIYIVGNNISNVGTITATTFSGSLNGNAATATTLQTSRTLWGNSFNGSANIDQMIWINAGGYINGRSTFIMNSSKPADIIFKNGETSTGNYGAWAISARNGESSSQYGLTFWRGSLNEGTATEACIMKIASNGKVIIGQNIYTTTASYQLHVVGDIYATGGVTALSDIRHKTIINNTRLQVSDIARMRAVNYVWNDGREDKGMHVGSIAQDWQQILPEVVLRANDAEGTLSLQYGVAALISSIIIARKVVNHEERIKALEKENADLKQAYSFIKNAYDYLKMDYENLKLKIA